MNSLHWSSDGLVVPPALQQGAKFNDLHIAQYMSAEVGLNFGEWAWERLRLILERHFFTDMYEMWETVWFVRIVPFLGGFLALLHYSVLLVFRLRSAVWDWQTAVMSAIVMCTSFGSYKIHYFDRMRCADRKKAVLVLSCMYHVMPCLSIIINAQVRIQHVTILTCKWREVTVSAHAVLSLFACFRSPGWAIFAGCALRQHHLHFQSILLQQVGEPWPTTSFAWLLRLRQCMRLHFPSARWRAVCPHSFLHVNCFRLLSRPPPMPGRPSFAW
jgi:hypothetical protein